jgi:hypothetical protein
MAAVVGRHLHDSVVLVQVRVTVHMLFEVEVEKLKDQVDAVIRVDNILQPAP